MIRMLLLLPILCVALAAGCRTMPAEPAKTNEIQNVLSKQLAAYVFIGGGSGVVISPDGYVITNAHVTAGHARWRVRLGDGRYFIAETVGAAPGTDLCLLKIEHGENLPFIPLGDSDQLATGDVVVAIGNPFGLGNLDGKPTVTLGVVSATHIDRPRAFDAIQTDAPINPGNSGGPILSVDGELVGISSQIETRFGLKQNTGVGYAISSNQILRFLPALKSAGGGEIAPAGIPGVRMRGQLDDPAVVEWVAADSPASKAGLKKGDIICSVGEMSVSSLRELISTLSRYPIGAELVLRGIRGAEKFECTVKLNSEPRPSIGITLGTGNAPTIDSVEPNSPASLAGLREGDVIVRIGDMPIRSRLSFYSQVRRLKPGKIVPFTVRRDGKDVVCAVRVGEQK